MLCGSGDVFKYFLNVESEICRISLQTSAKNFRLRGDKYCAISCRTARGILIVNDDLSTSRLETGVPNSAALVEVDRGMGVSMDIGQIGESV